MWPLDGDYQVKQACLHCYPQHKQTWFMLPTQQGQCQSDVMHACSTHNHTNTQACTHTHTANAGDLNTPVFILNTTNRKLSDLPTSGRRLLCVFSSRPQIEPLWDFLSTDNLQVSMEMARVAQLITSGKEDASTEFIHLWHLTITVTNNI